MQFRQYQSVIGFNRDRSRYQQAGKAAPDSLLDCSSVQIRVGSGFSVVTGDCAVPGEQHRFKIDAAGGVVASVLLF